MAVFGVNNYIEGKSPAAFDVLFWNADTTPDGGPPLPSRTWSRWGCTTRW